MMLALIVLAIVSLLASGIVFKHFRISTYLAAAGAIFQVQWLLLTLIDRWVLPGVASAAVFSAGAATFGAVWLLRVKQWQRPFAGWRMANILRRETAVLLVLVPVLASAGAVVSVNGRRADGSIALRGFYNGDTVTLAALTERSRLTDGLVQANPFAAGAALEYPTLLHGALASLLDAVGFSGPVLQALPGLVMLHVLMIVPLLFLLWDAYWPEPAEAWRQWLGMPSRWWVHLAQAGVTLLVLAGFWDNFIYPQSHFFLTGMFLLLVCLLLPGKLKLAQPVALVLLLSNAVTGAAAGVLASAAFAVRAGMHGAGKRRRGLLAAGALGWLLLIPLLGPGEAALGWPQFYYSAAFSFAHAVPLLLLLVPGLLLFGDRFRLSAAAVALLLALAMVTFVFSARAIVAENASRFVDHALLLALPLLLPGCIQLWHWARQKLRHEAAPLDLAAARWIIAGAIVLLVLLPGAVAAARAYDNLLLREPKVIGADLQLVLRELALAAPADARVLAAPVEPFAVPLLTGRSLLRADDYWLSPQDAVLEDVRAAFAGNTAAQQRTAAQADYLLLTRREADRWDVASYEHVAGQGDISLYRIR